MNLVLLVLLVLLILIYFIIYSKETFNICEDSSLYLSTECLRGKGRILQN